MTEKKNYCVSITIYIYIYASSYKYIYTYIFLKAQTNDWKKKMK